MPRRRRNRRQRRDELDVEPSQVSEAQTEGDSSYAGSEEGDSTEEQPLVVPEDVDVQDREGEGDEWPDWAYGERRRRAGRSRRQRRKDRKRKGAASLPETDEKTPAFFDQSRSSEEGEPAVVVDPSAREVDRGPDAGTVEPDPAEAEVRDRAEAAVGSEAEVIVDVPEQDGTGGEQPAEPERVDPDAEEEPSGYGVVPVHDLDREPDTGSGVDTDLDLDEEIKGEGEYEEGEDAPYRPISGDVVPGHVGPRRAALYERKRKQRRFASLVGLGLVIALVVGITSLSGRDGRDDGERDRSHGTVATNEDSVESMLVFGTRETDPSAGAVWLALLSVHRDSNQGAVVYLPAHTAVEVPGRGLLPLGEVAAVDVPLLIVSTESLLGIEIDSYIELSNRDAQVLFGSFAPLQVDVPTEVSVPAGSGRSRLIFTEGSQELDGERLAQLLFVVGIDGDDVELGSRHLAFWDALFDTFGSRSEELEQAMVQSAAVLAESDRAPREAADFIADLASLPEDVVALTSLPVQQVSVGEGELYGVEEEELRRFIQDTTGARSAVGDQTRIQVLNGVGVPGIGDDVAELLVDEGFRVSYSGNARHFDYEKSLIITYERTDEGIALAERARELLGVGEVQVSAQDQGIVDLTIVVGRDFLERT